MKSSKTQTMWLQSVLVTLLAGCVSTTNPIDCQPTAPGLTWYEVGQGGAYYPKPAHAELQQYIEDLNRCIEQLTTPAAPGLT